MTAKTQPSLYIVGDSFSQHFNGTNPWPLWTDQLGQLLDMEVKNASIPGTSQDWQWSCLESLDLKPDDRLLVVLTSPERFWFFKDRPDLGNIAWSSNVAQVLPDRSRQVAVKSFVTEIWRRDLALQHQTQRLRSLAWMAQSRSWSKPWVISAFANVLPRDAFQGLHIVRGSLCEDVQYAEYQGQPKTKLMADIWANIDCRYNHMCRSNHQVLAQHLAEAIGADSELDLATLPWHKDIITDSLALDENFARDQLDFDSWTKMNRERVRFKLGLNPIHRLRDIKF